MILASLNNETYLNNFSSPPSSKLLPYKILLNPFDSAVNLYPSTNICTASIKAAVMSEPIRAKFTPLEQKKLKHILINYFIITLQ